MGIVVDLLDEHRVLASAKEPWARYHRNVAAWVLPQTENFDSVLNDGMGGVMAVVGTPVAADRSKHIYDMTSLWAIDRLTAGLVSLKTPESDHWHDLNVDNDFGYDPSYDETVALEKTRDYLFKIRGNPKSGFWSAHKAAVKSMCAFGDGWMYVEEQFGSRLPFTYEYMPIPELYPAVGPDGNPNRMHRLFQWSAYQVVKKFGDKAGSKITEMANDPKRRHERVQVLHVTQPREDAKRAALGVRGAAFASYYVLPTEELLIGESGFYEFPFIRYAWSNTGQRPFCEGPVALCLAEIQSLQEMAKNELLAGQMLLRPPIAVAGKNFSRLNFNAGATNPGLITPEGKQLFAPMNGGVRPDFAQVVMETRRNALREMLYLNLWQILINDARSADETATRSMLRAQEKGEMLGPVGISLNAGLSATVDREISILGRKGAFDGESPLAMPESLKGADVSPQFTSPLDRLRRMGQVNGVKQLLEFLPVLEQVQPGISRRIDGDEILELVQDVMGAPAKTLRDRKVSAAAGQQQEQAAGLTNTLAAAQGAGDAMRALGEGGAAAAQGAEAAASSPILQRMLQGAQAA